LPVVLEERVVLQLLESLKADPSAKIAIDLEAQIVNGEHRFEIDAFSRHCLLEGIDELGYTLTQIAAIESFEKGYRA
jgi:3-isopropylmalate/(R)-2-methylmalate dehydratase small subunit